jgi:hypothetical protein
MTVIINNTTIAVLSVCTRKSSLISQLHVDRGVLSIDPEGTLQNKRAKV